VDVHWGYQCPDKPTTAVLFSNGFKVQSTSLDRSTIINALCVRETQTYKSVGIAVDGQTTADVFVDGGAGFSCVSDSYLRKRGWTDRIEAPIGNKSLHYAAAHLETTRVGKISLDVTLHFPFANKRTLHFTMLFEVLNIPWDFLLGAETMRTMFGNNEMIAYGAKISSIADRPRNVRHTPRDEAAIAAILEQDRLNSANALFTADVHHDHPRSSPLSSSSSTTSSTRTAPSAQ
jgi:hypothetical protein